MRPHAEIRFICDAADKLINSELSYEKRVIVEDDVFQHLKGLKEDKAIALLRYMWLHLSKHPLAEHYKLLQKPKLKTDKLTEYYEHFGSTWPKADTTLPTVPKSRVERRIQELRKKDIRSDGTISGSSYIWNYQCYNCLGLGHARSECSSPIRVGSIPNVKSKMSRYFDMTNHRNMKEKIVWQF
ncbi:uncharacterized protein KGF55_002428 [Candida pseudojiufengensis]|uniref:uncharacterized protein n=1 Tax=Candida pseudojiufengensis TaxID=497109 RepID=UPI002225A95B|nr:uncharacterized protein KGF55_002428 [Candida pseudojiufengensis]KAI5963548.1 hypothetical protein KGF55_002428 [Candida pseudojiufengensis]